MQRFEQFDAARRDEAGAPIRQAVDSGTEALVLCPTNSRRDARNAAQRDADHVHALRQLRPLLESTGGVGLVGAGGLRGMRGAAQVPGDTDRRGSRRRRHTPPRARHLPPPSCGRRPVHPGLDPALDAPQMCNGHRVPVGAADRLGNAAQLRRLLDAGYAGLASFEPFAEEIAAAPDVEARMRASMAPLRQAVASA